MAWMSPSVREKMILDNGILIAKVTTRYKREVAAWVSQVAAITAPTISWRVADKDKDKVEILFLGDEANLDLTLRGMRGLECRLRPYGSVSYVSTPSSGLH